MQKKSVTAKGKYLHAHNVGAVTVDSYVVVKEGEDRFLLLKLRNGREEPFDALTLKVTQYSAEGAVLSSERYRYGSEVGAENGLFVLADKIPLRRDCADFRVSVLSVRYGKYAYNKCRGGVCVEYVPEGEDKPFDVTGKERGMKGKKVRVTPFRVKVSVLICLFALLLAACVCALGFYGVERYTETATGFLCDGVEYSFINGDKSAQGTLSVTGYRGSNNKVRIPQRVGGYRVVRVGDGAFNGNSQLTEISFDEEVSIGADAFYNCHQLSEVNFEKVISIGADAFCNTGVSEVNSSALTYVGARAFQNCNSLRSVYIGGEGASLYLGDNAFVFCNELETVRIEKQTDYAQLYGLFSDCYSLRSLSLYNCGDKEERGIRLSDLFGGTQAELQSLSVGTIGELGDEFCRGFQFLSEVSIGSIESGRVGASAFADCVRLSQLDLPDNIAEVGDYAFYRTQISSFESDSLQYLGTSAFEECESLRSVELSESDSLGYISYRAFYWCRRLSEVSLPASLTEIGDNAFEDCAQLTSLRLPAKISYIGSYAFSNCSSLREMTLPESVASAGFGIFSGCNAMEKLTAPFASTYNAFPFLAYLFGGGSYTNSYVVPASLREVRVTGTGALNEGVFYDCFNLREIQLPEGLLLIGRSAFCGCSQLKSIQIPDSVLSVGEYAFANCNQLSSLGISQAVSFIGEYAFAECASLTSLTLPDSVKEVGRGALSGCSSLTSLTAPFVGHSRYEEGYLAYLFGGYGYYDSYCIPFSLSEVCLTDSSVLAEGAFYNCQGLISAELPEKMTNIGNSAFQSCPQLSLVTFPEGLGYIGEYAFSDCISLTSLTLPNSVQQVGRGAFSGCNSLVSFTAPFVGNSRTSENYLSYLFGSYSYYDSYMVPASLREVVLTGGDSLSSYAFYGCDGLTSVSLPAGLTQIGNYAFYNCMQLTSASLPAGLEQIGDYAFYNCTQLTSADLPAGLTYLGEYAFCSCLQLTSASLPAGLSKVGNYAFGQCVSLKEVTFSEGLTEIGDHAFEGCSQLSFEQFPQTLTTIGEYAFSGCISLTALTLPDSVQQTGRGAFSGCNSLTSLTAPFVGNSRTSENYLSYLFGAYSYYDSYMVPASLGEVILTDVDRVADYAFYNCAQLTSVSLPEGLEQIGDYAFQSCGQLTSVFLPEGLSYLGTESFGGCGRLQSISLPSTLSYIGSNAFTNCYRLYEVYNNSDLPLTCGMWEYGMAAYYAYAVYGTGEEPVDVEKDGYRLISADAGWVLVGAPEDAEDVSLPASFRRGGQTVDAYEVAHHLFYQSETLKSFYAPAAVTAIGSYALAYCGNLESAVFDPASPLTQISEYLFCDCASLAEVSLPESVEIIRTMAFSDCREMKTFTVGEKVTDIQWDAFLSCDRLYSVRNESALPLRAGSSDYGRVAQNAIAVLSKENEEMSFVQIDGVEYAVWEGQWYAVGCEDGVSELRLEAFYYGDEYVDDIIVKQSAFREKNGLVHVYIGEAVSQIGSQAFASCNSLQSVHFENTRLAELPDQIFYNCSSLSSVVFPVNLNKIGNESFAYCYSLRTLTLPAALREIGQYAFTNVPIVSLELPSGLLVIGDWAFSNTSVQELILPEGLQTVGTYAFYNCSDLCSVTLLGAPSIGDSAFDQCVNLLLVNNFGGLKIEAGERENGAVALYALYVNTDPSLACAVVRSGAFYFLGRGDEWSLVRYRDMVGNLFLPESVTYDGGEISSYTVAFGAFVDLNLSSLYIPCSVVGIESGAFGNVYYIGGVYYGGTAEEWKQICQEGCGLENWPIYYYAECVHDAEHWTFDAYGNISVSLSPCEWRESRPATCSQAGEMQYVCLSCGEVLSVTETEKAVHTPDENGVCVVCKEEGLLLTDAKDLPDYVKNDGENPFVTGENGLIPSDPLSETESCLTLVAEEGFCIFVRFELAEGATLVTDLDGSLSEQGGSGETVFVLFEGQTLRTIVRNGGKDAGVSSIRLIVYPR